MAQQKQIPIEEALNLVGFEFFGGEWHVKHVKGDVIGDVIGDVWGSVECDVRGNVYGTISGRKWQFVNETPKEKLKRLIEEGADKSQLLEAFNQLENNQ